MDISSLNVPVIYYIDAENYQIVRVELSLAGMNDMLNDILEQAMAESGEESYGMTMTIIECEIVCSDISYDPVEVPELPDEAKTAVTVEY